MKLKHRVGILFLGFALMGLSLGETAPDFEAKNQDGKLVHLAEFRGKPVLIYFYPKDQTPGWTRMVRLPTSTVSRRFLF
jgi:peroxiredoxin